MNDSDEAANALAWAADELETAHDKRETTDPPDANHAKVQRGQMLNDARWLRRQAVAMRGRLADSH